MTKRLMNKAVGLAMALFVLTPVFAFSLPALAAPDVWNGSGVNGADFAAKTTLGNVDLRTTVANTIRVIIGFLGIIAVVIILIGGFKWMTAGGNEDKVGEAKKLLVAGLIGLVIILMAYAIAAFVLSQLVKATAG